MATELDPRILRVGIEIAGKLQTYDELAITAIGCKYANANQNECEVQITNLAKAARDYILTETSPFNKNKARKQLILEAGRRSTGTSVVFVGDIVSSTVAQPPDVTISLKCATGNYLKGSIVQRSQGATCQLRQLCAQVASDLGLRLDYQAPDKQIANYTFTGSALRQVDHLGRFARVNAYVDDRALIVKPYGKPRAGSTRVLNVDTGMIGIPEFTERGIKVKMLYDNQTGIGSGLEVRSVLNPATNGLYSVYKLGFELANRDTPFYLVAEASRA